MEYLRLRPSRSASSTAWSSPAPQTPGDPLRLELADVLRLGRRLVRMAVAIARAETPAGLLAEHLGSEAPSLPVVGEGWAAYDHVNLQGALDRWTQIPGRSTILVGLTSFQHADVHAG